MITTVTTFVRLLPDPVDLPLDDLPDPSSIITFSLPPLPGQGFENKPLQMIVLCQARMGNAESAAVIRTSLDRQISPPRPVLQHTPSRRWPTRLTAFSAHQPAA